MLKNILNVKGAEILNKKIQKSIIGGNRFEEGFGGSCQTSHDCNEATTIPSVCCSGICVYTSNWQNVC